jgi:hypothetical protein
MKGSARRATRFAFLVAAVLLLAGTAGPAVAVPEGPPFPSPAWTAREAANFALTAESASEQLKDTAFVARFAQQSAENLAEFAVRQIAHTSLMEESNICATWSGPCTGDPFRYPGVDPFYDAATVFPVEFADRGGARLSGRVWAPSGVPAGVRLPGKEGFRRWEKAGVPTAQVQIRGGTHYEFSQLPGFPNRSWSIGTAMSQH